MDIHTRFTAQAAPAADAAELPQPAPDAPSIPEPRDVAYPGVLQLQVDARDVVRGIYRVRQIIPVARAGEMVLLYPKWLPGYHAPQAPIELFAGLRISAGGEPVAWKRHPVTINAFSVEVDAGVDCLEVEFQFLSPTAPSQGRVLCTEAMLCLPWNAVLLYPAGYYARQITVIPSLTLPEDWDLTCAMEQQDRDGGTWRFAAVPLDILVDSPVLAGRYLRRIALDDQVGLTLVSDRPDQIEATPEQLAPHRSLVEQADRLFRTRHFDRFEMLLALSDELTGAGVEHHRSFEAVTTADYFTNWDARFTRRDTVSHEYLHSWNGKHRRGADSWTPTFEKPIRNSLMWVYEGLTQYWTNVLAARSGLWTAAQTREAIALVAAKYDARPGSQWRPLADTTRDPIIAARASLPWPSWQRSEDYYNEGGLIWLDVDTRLRELSGEQRSLDDFARDFFGAHPGDWGTRTYVFDDVVDALDRVVSFDWATLFHEALADTHRRAPLAGLERGGYRLAFRDHPSGYQSAFDAEAGQVDLTHSIGLTVGTSGAVQDVLWDGPAFESGLTIGCTVTAIEGRSFDPDWLRQAVARAGEGGTVKLAVTKGKTVRAFEVTCSSGPRYAHLEPIDGARARLDEILAPVQA
ncbi:MAG: putative metalloprotease, contains C-terminal domain [Sphingomonas bacterium]|uniref:M61 family metallopeptidase n=1 Tax=Sphingomonas bacterium TaxID=1895847 RepID=UPI002606A296|nr:peptidase M61 [Sphingomonas bacterium]MDB5694768.1 putative metalloprotease, contains C-terminal domain [Sphingomonas bacterium]